MLFEKYGVYYVFPKFSLLYILYIYTVCWVSEKALPINTRIYIL